MVSLDHQKCQSLNDAAETACT